MTSKKLSTLLASHMEAKAHLDSWKAKEKALRIQVIDELFPSAGEGTHTILENGLKIKCAIKMNYKFDLEELSIWEEQFTDEEKRCVRRNPTLDLTEYRRLSENDKMMIDECVTVTPGLPALTIVEDES